MGRLINFRSDCRMTVRQLYCKIRVGVDKRGRVIYEDPYKELREKALVMIDNAKTDNDVLRVMKYIREESYKYE